jgi:hypothetical protein
MVKVGDADQDIRGTSAYQSTLQVDIKRILDTPLPSPSGLPGQAAPAPAAGEGEASRCPAPPASGAGIAAQLLSESASLPTIAEEEPSQAPSQAPTPAEDEATLCRQLTV